MPSDEKIAEYSPLRNNLQIKPVDKLRSSLASIVLENHRYSIREQSVTVGGKEEFRAVLFEKDHQQCVLYLRSCFSKKFELLQLLNFSANMIELVRHKDSFFFPKLILSQVYMSTTTESVFISGENDEDDAEHMKSQCVDFFQELEKIFSTWNQSVVDVVFSLERD